MRKYLQVLALVILGACFLRAQSNIWSDIPESRIILSGKRYIIPDIYRTLELNLNEIRSLLKEVPLEYTPDAVRGKSVIELPMPDGTYQKFKFWESPAMAPELQLKYPQIRTYTGQGIDDPYASLKFDLTPEGFHAQVLSPDGRVFIDPYDMGDINYYICYYTKDYHKKTEFECQVYYQSEYTLPEPDYYSNILLNPSGPQLRTYRLANAATGEYTAFHGGTVTLGLAAVTTSINRVNGVYEKEVAVRMVLVANNNLIIYTNAGTDPYTNDNGSAMLTQNINNLNSVIGSSNYDIGHVFSTGGGGVAYLGCVCTSSKAGGVTGSPSPVGDSFDIDYVAHEMGHQFGGNHSFNGNTGSCSGGNRNASTAYEPGSGSTIMAYAGICPPQDLQAHSDAYFHVISFDEIRAYTTTGNGNNCAVITNTGNNPPIVNVPSGGFYIPKSTPFSITGSASDPDSDVLTYCWEEFDLVPAGDPNSPSGNAPIFRSFNPVYSPTRTFPKLSDLLNNTQTIGEILPSYGRNLTFRLTARDNRAGGGGVNYNQVAFYVDGNSGPFTVTSPNTSVSWQGNTQQTVIWSVANTNASPVNCANVNILLSTDGGNNFNTLLISGTPNDGSELITIPNLPTSSARIKVEAANNIFFDISNVNFTIVNNPIVNNPVSFNAESVSSSQINLSFTPNANNNNVIVVWNYSGIFNAPSGSPPPVGGALAGGLLLYNGTSSPVNHTGLGQATTYFYKAFSYDGINYSPGLVSNAHTFYAVPYSQTFDNPVFPPVDWSLANGGAGNLWVRGSSDPYAGTGVMIYNYNAVQPADAWAFTPGFYLESSKKYYITFYQKVQLAADPEKLKVTAGTSPDAASQNIILWDNAGGVNLTNTTYQKRIAEFNCTLSGRYYFAFNCYSDAGMRILFVDEVSIAPQPGIDLALSQFYQLTGLPVPENVNPKDESPIIFKKSKMTNNKLLFELKNKPGAVKSSDNNSSDPVNSSNYKSWLLSGIGIRAQVTNLGINPSSFTMDWYVNGALQTQYLGTVVDPGTAYNANLTYVPSERGTFNTLGILNVVNDENPGNNINSFRMRVYPDVYSRTIYDRGDNNVDAFFGWNNLTIPLKAGVRFTADSTIKLAGVDFIYRTEIVTSGQIIVQVRNAGTLPGAPGSVLYTRIYNTSPYFPSGSDGDYIHFAFGDDAPVIPSGLEYWITVKMPAGILYPGGTQGTGIIAGRSFFEQSPDTTLWNSLVIGTDQYAWIMRSVQVAAVDTTFQLSVSILNGWNMVSVPGINPDGQGINTWWINHIGNIYKYISGTGYSIVNTASPTEGYWMKNMGNEIYNTGDEWPAGGILKVPHIPLSLNGWSLIGVYECPVVVSNLTTIPPGLTIGNIYRYSGGYQIADTLFPGYGYWIKVAGQLVLPPCGGTYNELKNVELFSDAVGKIIISDASGKKFILYALKEDADQDRYELPPLPPAGAADVRFGSGNVGENLYNSELIKMQGLEYPIKLKSEGIDIKVSDPSGKLFNVNLNSGEEISVNTQLNALMVSEKFFPDEFSLDQNYPNPFNPSTKIRFSLPENQESVKLTIYNILGQKVAELVNTALKAGIYEFEWNALSAAAGIYLYELRTEKFVSVGKMLLLK